MSIKEAFFETCKNATPARKHYVSLYATVPFYGGPEEGGWWGRDQVLVAYQECDTDEQSKALVEAVEALADKLSKEAKDSFNRQCARECEWLEARGLDDSFLPEVDGEHRYWVAVENRVGEYASEGDRYYS